MNKEEVREFYRGIQDLGNIYDVDLGYVRDELGLDLEFGLGEEYPIDPRQNIRDHVVATWAEAFGISREVFGYEDREVPNNLKENALKANKENRIYNPYGERDLIQYSRLLDAVSDDVGHENSVTVLDILQGDKDGAFRDMIDDLDDLLKEEHVKKV